MVIKIAVWNFFSLFLSPFFEAQLPVACVGVNVARTVSDIAYHPGHTFFDVVTFLVLFAVISFGAAAFPVVVFVGFLRVRLAGADV